MADVVLPTAVAPRAPRRRPRSAAVSLFAKVHFRWASRRPSTASVLPDPDPPRLPDTPSIPIGRPDIHAAGAPALPIAPFHPFGFPDWLLLPSPAVRARTMMASEDSTFDALAVNAVNGMPPPVPPKDPPPPHLKDAKGLLQHPSTTTLTNPPGSRRIHPSEISRIACLGDSLLTGLCLEQDSTSARARLLSVLARRVHRGIAWIVSGEHRENTCIAGGADGVLSVGRMVRWYAPEVRGLCERRTRLGSKGSGLNVARSGAFVHDLDAQVQELLRRINCERVPAIPEDGWTLAFIWIGANDVVSRTREQLLATYAPHLLRAIRQLRAGLGTHRLLVCVLTLPDLSHVALEDERLESTTEAAAASVVRETVRLLNLEIEHALARLECDDTDADPERFRVRVVPVPGDEVPRDLYRECFVAVDGSHPNIVAHELFAKSVWVNLCEGMEAGRRTYREVLVADWCQPGFREGFA